MYNVLRDVLSDVGAGFPASAFIHLGFDEVNFKCWTSDPSVASYLEQHKQNATDLLRRFFRQERGLLPPGKAAVSSFLLPSLSVYLSVCDRI